MKKMSKTTKTSGKASLVFFGSGPVAKASLLFLARHFDIEAVVTKPVTALEMSQAAPASALHAVKDKQELTSLITAQPFKSSIGIIVDFGIIVEQTVIDYFPLGIVNSHFSLLPEWRGADPISFAILSGQTKTGVSLMLIVEKLDEGDLLAQSSLDIEPKSTTPTLTHELVELSNAMLKEIVPLYIKGKVIHFKQRDDIKPTYSRKLTKSDGLIDWHKPAEQIEREIRAFIDWPKSRTVLANKEVIITKSYAVPRQAPGSKPGDLEFVKEAGIIMVATGNGSLCIEKLKPAGKREMTAAEFLAGNKLF